MRLWGGRRLREVLSGSRQTGEIGHRSATAGPAAAILAATLVMLAGAAIVGLLAQGAPRALERQSAAAPELRDDHSRSLEKSAPAFPQVAAATPDAGAPGPRDREGAGSGGTPAAGQDPAPRLKPQPASLAQASREPIRPEAETGAPGSQAQGSDLVVLGQSMLAPEDYRAAFYFEDEMAGPVALPPPPAVALAGDIEEEPRTDSLRLAKGENFVDALRRAGVRAEDRNAAAAAFARHYDLRRLQPGQELRITTAAPAQTIFQMVAEGHEPQSYLLALDFRADAASRIALRRGIDGAYSAKVLAVALSSRLASVSGRINGSLYNSAKRIGAPDKVVADLASIFAYDVDFQREVFGGDEFEAVFEARYDENGRLVEAGDILYGRMKWKGRQKEKGYYRFLSAEGGAKADYFDWSGESAKRLLMKTPIDGARLSSGFGARRHPISGYTKQHQGVDFAAPRGTPIKAAGDGVIERADRYGGYGNYVRIRHGQGYKTAYAHMSGFAKGVRAGVRVEQGDTIGYVGSTGASTGPHLHYEVLQEGKHLNPQKLKVATGVSLSGAELRKFKEARDALDAKRRTSEAERLAEDASAKQL